MGKSPPTHLDACLSDVQQYKEVVDDLKPELYLGLVSDHQLHYGQHDVDAYQSHYHSVHNRVDGWDVAIV